MKNILFLLLLKIVLFFSFIFADWNWVKVNLLDIKSNDYQSISWGGKDIRDFLKSLNEILWYIAVVLVFALFIYMWIILMKSEWNEEDMKRVKAISKAMWIWIFVILLSGAIIKIVVTLFWIK